MVEMDEAEQMVIGLIAVFQVLTLGMKLSGELPGWSWWWVFVPIWGPLLLAFCLLVLLLTVASIIYWAQSKKGDTK